MEVGRIGVVGAGVMGSEIAQACAAAGIAVVLVDVDAAAAARGVAHIRSICDRRVARGRMTPDEADALTGRVAATTDLGDIGDCDLVIEAAPERMDLKRDLWRRIDAAAPPGALLASNTSGLSISALAGETGRPDRVVGLHFFNPASVMRLVEVIRGDATSDATVDAGAAFAERLGKVPVRVAECPGFLVNRILVRALCEAYLRADELGADRAAADAAVVAGGPAPMGPFALGDLVGLDTLLHVQRDLHAAYGARFDAGTSLAAEVAAGRLGQKSGAGLVLGRDATPADDDGHDIAERYHLGALDEACRCLDESVATLPDIDVAMRLGAGWDVGPFAWADALGLPGLVERAERLARDAGSRFTPPAALTSRASAGATFTNARKEER